MSALPKTNPYLPMAAEVVDNIEEAPGINTLRLRLRDAQQRADYRFAPGQFNMLYLANVGEVPISISSDPGDVEFIDHTIRAVGRVTEGMVRLKAGDIMGLRGPFGAGWPMEQAKGRNLLVITGGIGCAPTASVVQYAHARRDQYGKISVCHGVRKPDDLIYGERFANWCKAPDTVCMFASQEPAPGWSGRTGLVTQLLDDLAPEAIEGMAMMCGPEPMMRAVAEELLNRGRPIEDIYVSMERGMQCGLGHCGHCQYGPDFICKDGPVFPYARVRRLMPVKGF
jgi:NAD(P)H-flavin reductase